MTILFCLYPYLNITTVGGVSSASCRLVNTIKDLNLPVKLIFYRSFSFKYFKSLELALRLLIDLFNLYINSWQKKAIFLMTDQSSLVRTFVFIVLLRISLNFTRVIVDIRGGGPTCRLSSSSPNKIILHLVYICASCVVLQTSNFSNVPDRYHHKLRFICNPLPSYTINCSAYPFVSSQSPFLLSFAGRITESKGIDLLFDLLDNSSTNLHLLLAGSITLSSSNRERMSSLMDLGLISYFGSISTNSTCQMINKSNLFVHLSSHPWEGMPNSINDAISVCTPILATPIGFILDLYSEDHITYISDLSAESLANKINLIQNSYSLYQTKAFNAFTYAQSSYSYDSYKFSISSLFS